MADTSQNTRDQDNRDAAAAGVVPAPVGAVGDNTQKDPDDWTTGDEPMTGAQASYLRTLSEEAHDPDTFSEGLTKAEASKRIDALRGKVGLARGR